MPLLLRASRKTCVGRPRLIAGSGGIRCGLGASSLSALSAAPQVVGSVVVKHASPAAPGGRLRGAGLRELPVRSPAGLATSWAGSFCGLVAASCCTGESPSSQAPGRDQLQRNPSSVLRYRLGVLSWGSAPHDVELAGNDVRRRLRIAAQLGAVCFASVARLAASGQRRVPVDVKERSANRLGIAACLGAVYASMVLKLQRKIVICKFKL